MIELVAIVAIVTQVIKKGINNSTIGFLKRIIIEKWGAVLLGVVVSFGVVFYHALTLGIPFGVSLLILAGQVAVAATTGYSLLKVARPK
jgi:Zn-dependent membrane protease YugP